MNTSQSAKQNKESTLHARTEKSFFLLQHNLPQSCEAASRATVWNVNSMYALPYTLFDVGVRTGFYVPVCQGEIPLREACMRG